MPERLRTKGVALPDPRKELLAMYRMQGLGRGIVGLICVVLILQMVSPTLESIIWFIDNLAWYVAGAVVLYLIARVVLARLDR